jgi:DDE superfamily endonuclease
LGTAQQVRYWCADESRLGLKTLTGRTITLKGVKPEGIVGWNRKNFYLYGVVEPATGDSFFWEFSHLDSKCFQEFLDLFSEKNSSALNFIQMDNGSFHKSLALKWPDNVIPIFQPPNSPELNPIVGEAFPKGTFMGTDQV